MVNILSEISSVLNNDAVYYVILLAVWRPLLPYHYSYCWASECPDVKNYKWRLNPVWHRMLCSPVRVDIFNLFS